MRELGFTMEQRAKSWLESQGCKRITNNFNCRYGEIDLIMLDHTILLFIEVRYREKNQFGGAHSSINSRKKTAIIRSSQIFLQKNPQWQNYFMRYDVVTIQGDQWTWIKGAFY